MGIDDEGSQRVNGVSLMKSNNSLSLNLLPNSDYDHLESRLTSVSSKKAKNFAGSPGSLSTVLG